MAQILYSKRPTESSLRTILRRLAFLLLLYLTVFTVLWLDKDGLKDATKFDASGKRIAEQTALDMLYFAAVSMSTTGYGDIVPVTPLARAIDIVLVTPARLLVWIIFWGTTFQITARTFMEEYQMRRLKKRLKDHTILCGYGHTGRSMGREWARLGGQPGDLVIVDSDPVVAQEAANDGHVALHGDATREAMLETANVAEARYLVAATARDDTNILICLTAANLNPTLHIVARANEDENAKLMRSSGARTVVTPATAGGNLMALATHDVGLVSLLEDIMTSGGRLQLGERLVEPGDIGQNPKKLPGVVVVGVERGGRLLPIAELDAEVLRRGDKVITLSENLSEGSSTGPGGRAASEGAKQGHWLSPEGEGPGSRVFPDEAKAEPRGAAVADESEEPTTEEPSRPRRRRRRRKGRGETGSEEA